MPAKSPSARPVSNAKAPEAYHHVDLRVALIAAAREALETTPPDGVTLKSLAARLGVSQPAPYRHFENREALLAAVATDGFERFGAALAAAKAAGPPELAFERACLAYLAFGRSNMGVYRQMFSSRMAQEHRDPVLDAASKASFDFLLEQVAGIAPPERLPLLALWVWSTLHGLVMLESEKLATGPIENGPTPAEVVHEMLATLASKSSTSP